MRKFTTQEFVERAKKIHGTDRYDYSLTEYVAATKKVKIICPKHGVFEQTADAHSAGKGCVKCAGSYSMTPKEYVEELKSKFGSKLDFSKTVYVNAKTKVIAECPIHGEFLKDPRALMKSPYGCPECGKASININQASNTKEFTKKALKKHNGYYSYEKVDYKRSYKKVIITCPIHGDFEQSPQKHLDGNGCQKCGLERKRKAFVSNKDEFVKKARFMHIGKYSYEKVNYFNAKKKVCITCPTHGDFYQTPDAHIAGHGCPKCNNSLGENECERILIKLGLHYLDQFSFFGKGYYRLRYDFYLPEYNTCIEINGRQHYSPVDFFGGIKAFLKQAKRDIVKKHYCKRHGIGFLEIPYWEIDSIEDILSKYIDARNPLQK